VKTDNDIAKAGIVALVQEAYGLPLTRLEFKPKGEAGYCYVGWADGDRRWFVKLFQAHRNEGFAFSLRVSRDLHDAGYEHALPPMVTTEGEAFATYEGHAVAVFPFIEGVSLYEDETRPYGEEVSDEELAGLGTLVAGLHAATPRLSLDGAPREAFDFTYDGVFRRFLAGSAEFRPVNDFQRELLSLWDGDRENVAAAYRQFQAMQRRCRAAGRPFVLTHGDCHLANVMRDTEGRYHLVDWSDALLAPPERDLTHYTDGGDRFAGFLDVYLGAFDPGVLDPDVFAFYIYQWCVHEIGSYTNRVMYRNPGKANDEQNESDLAEFRKYVPVRESESLRPGVMAVAEVLRQAGVSSRAV
jgi:Ser/Thr protein kinase RdoA (MazF antagonist)